MSAATGSASAPAVTPVERLASAAPRLDAAATPATTAGRTATTRATFPAASTPGTHRPSASNGQPARTEAVGATSPPTIIAMASSASQVPGAAHANAGDFGRWRAPLTPLVVQRRFDPPPHNWLPGHRGIDVRAQPGRSVRAAGAGRVGYAADLAGRGVVVVIHGALRTTYEPVNALVRPGDLVAPGEVIGTVGTGSGHCGGGQCLHIGLRRGSTYLDPMLLFGPRITRLVPW